MQRRTFLKTLAAVPAVTLWGADDELRIAVNQTTLESSPLLVREIPGVRVVLVENGRAASAQLVGGMVDAATGSETQALVNSVQQTDLRIILTLAESHYRMVARKPAGIRRVADLRGKRVGITPRTSSEYFLVDMLRAAGMNLGDVTLVTLEGPDMPAALVKKDVDAIAMWEPHTQNAIEALGAEGVVLKEAAYFERFNVNTTAKVLADPAKRKLLINMVKQVQKVSAELRKSPKPFLPAISKAIATPEPIITKIWPNFRFPAGMDQAKLRAVLETMEPWAASLTPARSERSKETLAGLVDGSVLSESGA